ncbi:MAG TPA: N-acetyltransferase [Nannocystis exedens]|nr:N-acetyltransferase [Nannocystis exedens]
MSSTGFDSDFQVEVREELPGESEAIAALNLAAFGQAGEGALVDALRAAGALTLSLVATAGGGETIIGHIAFSRVEISGPAGEATAVGLAPMAVSPEHQRQGVGARLIAEGLARLRAAGHRAVIVLGHPEYYPRFGFVRASVFGLRWEHPAPDEAFMAIELVAGALAGIRGVVRYRREFDAVE